MTTDSEQAPLFEQETIVEEDEAPATVWVVTARRDGCPHSFVEAVYDSEEAAEEHKQYLQDNAFGEMAIAWGMHERPVSSAFDGGEC
jgi:hypothetical protein